MSLREPDLNKPVFKEKAFMLETARVQLKWCPICSKPINEEDFTDSLSRKEYSISGMCQACQDEIFNEEDDFYDDLMDDDVELDDSEITVEVERDEFDDDIDDYIDSLVNGENVEEEEDFDPNLEIDTDLDDYDNDNW